MHSRQRTIQRSEVIPLITRNKKHPGFNAAGQSDGLSVGFTDTLPGQFAEAEKKKAKEKIV